MNALKVLCGPVFGMEVFTTLPADQGGAFLSSSGLVTEGKTECSSYDPTVKTATLMFIGQSLLGNNVPDDFESAYPGQVCNFNPYDGKMYYSSKPLLGPLVDAPTPENRDNVARRVADLVLDLTNPDEGRKFQRVDLINISIGGSQVTHWQTTYAPHLTAVIKSMIIRGIVPTAVIWGEGESANQAGMTQETYVAAGLAVIQVAREAGLPFSVPWFWSRETALVSGQASQIQAAQAQLVDPENNVWAGGDIDSIPFDADHRILPSPHLTAAGAALMATLDVAALQAYGVPF
jgi:hypothetical protein